MHCIEDICSVNVSFYFTSEHRKFIFTSSDIHEWKYYFSMITSGITFLVIDVTTGNR